jgi:dTDP-4-dehydrorhamnose reductase
LKIYIAGAGGMLGEAMFRVLGMLLRVMCTDIDLTEPWLSYCDFRDFDSYRTSVEAFGPDVLLHLGARTDLEYCERNPDDAYRTNTLAVEHAATLANAHGLTLVHISTSGIFDGAKRLYDDWDEPNPLGVHARSKFLGETIVQQRVPRHFIFRAGWMMGGGPAKDKKFIRKLLEQLARGARTLHVVHDKLGTPTYTIDFARNLELMLETSYYGLYNMVCGGETGRLEVARELLDILSLTDRVTIVPVDSAHFAKEYFAPRPPSERLRNYKLELRDLNIMRDWQTALREYIAEYYGEYVRTFAPDYDPHG